jgi:hypothetical protein
VLLNKRLTKFVFRSSIQSQERDRDVQGLWRSLNFVKLSEIKREISRSRLSLTVNSRIVGDLVERLATDQEFARRQRMLGELGRIATRIGLLELICSRALENFLPYLMLELRRRPAAGPGAPSSASTPGNCG